MSNTRQNDNESIEVRRTGGCTLVHKISRLLLAGGCVVGVAVSPFFLTSISAASSMADGFSGPSDISASGSHVWVTNSYDSVTELNASNRSLVRVIAAAADEFAEPFAITIVGSHLWIANSNGNSVTELNASNGSLVRVIAAAADGFSGPVAITTVGPHVWVANKSGNSVTELNASNGSLVRVIKL